MVTFLLRALRPLRPQAAMESAEADPLPLALSPLPPFTDGTREKWAICLFSFVVGDEEFCIGGASMVWEAKG
jgi:hypothetical protein